jgi:hypothetical protein
VGSSGAGPRPFTQRQARTIFLRVPRAEFGLVVAGRKTEFRASPRSCSRLGSGKPPAPAVAYAIFPSRGYKRQLLVLEATWREPLGAITAESLEREGQPDFAHFRRYWMKREKTAFKPTREVSVFQVRPLRPGDERELADALFERLYGEFR